MNRISKKSSKQVSQYDKIVKENIEAVLPSLLVKVMNIDVMDIQEIEDEIQRTKERKPDLLKIITDKLGNRFVFHLEFQVKNDPDMIYRELEYNGMLRRKYKLPVIQYVIFMGKKASNMQNVLVDDYLQFRYNLISIIDIDYQLFINSDVPEEVIFSILSSFGNEKPQVIVQEIMTRLSSLVHTDLELAKYLQQLRSLSNLRNFKSIIDTLMESITKYFKEENDFLYIKGRRDEQKIFILNMLKQTDFSVAKIAKIASVPLNFAKEVKAEFELSKNN
jgi:hypothetical protein